MNVEIKKIKFSDKMNSYLWSNFNIEIMDNKTDFYRVSFNCKPILDILFLSMNDFRIIVEIGIINLKKNVYILNWVINYMENEKKTNCIFSTYIVEGDRFGKSMLRKAGFKVAAVFRELVKIKDNKKNVVLLSFDVKISNS